MAQFYGSMEAQSRGRAKAPPPFLKTFRAEENTLLHTDKVARLEAKIAILEHENGHLKIKCETQATKVSLLQRFCKYHAIKLKIEDEFDRETNTDHAMDTMRSEIAGLSLSVGGASTISGVTINSPRSRDLPTTSESESPRLKVRYDRRVHGGGDGVENRFLYGSESVSQHKWMGPADGVGSPRLQNSKINAEDNKFRMRVSKDIHGLGTADAQLVYGSKEYEKRLVEEAKAHLARRDNRRRKMKQPDEKETDLFGRKRLQQQQQQQQQDGGVLRGDRKNSETEQLDETLFAGMLNPKVQQQEGSHQRHGTDLRAETQLLHRSQYRGSASSSARRPDIKLFNK